MLRIAFTGKATVGKTTAATYLAEKYNGFVFSFADKLKEIISDLWNINPWIDKSIEIRKLLQRVGHGLRQIDEDVWVKYLLRKHLAESIILSNVFIDDVRYKNEADMLLNVGFKIVYIERKDTALFLPEDLRKHDSEQLEGIKANFFISNNTTIDDLYRSLDVLVEEYRNGKL